MAYEIRWVVRGKVIRTAMYGETAAEELRELSTRTIELLDAGTGPLVHQIVDLMGLEKFPVNVGVMNGALIDFLRHPRMGWSILVADNRMVKYIAAMLAGLSRARIRVFDNVEAALVFLNEVDSTLPDLLALSHDVE